MTDSKIMLARTSARIRLLREWLAHDHGDAAYWWARDTTPSVAQAARVHLRRVAHLLQVEHATRRDRVIGPHADLDAQRAWLAGIPRDSTLAVVRTAEV